MSKIENTWIISTLFNLKLLKIHQFWTYLDIISKINTKMIVMIPELLHKSWFQRWLLISRLFWFMAFCVFSLQTFLYKYGMYQSIYVAFSFFRIAVFWITKFQHIFYLLVTCIIILALKPSELWIWIIITLRILFLIKFLLKSAKFL